MMNEQDMENLDSNEKSDHDLISMETLDIIRDGSQTHPTVNKMEARCKIRDCLCLIRSRILQRDYLLLTAGWF